VATNCWAVPFAMLGVAGVTATDTSVAGVTVKVTDGEVMLPKVAVMAVVPAATPVARPFVPAALLIVAVAGVPEFHVTVVVRTCVELSV
jgi:hypothetical protein